MKSFALPNNTSPASPVIIDADICNGCNKCVNICQVDLMIPVRKKGAAPIILYPEECWYCGCCVEICPETGAIKLNPPLIQRVRWKRKKTGEHFRV